MLNLPHVTLCCVDTRLPQMALEAMQTCMTRIAFGDAILITRPEHGLVPASCALRIIERDDIKSVHDYSRVMLKELGQHLRTTHLLIVQWDGYVLNPDMWQDEFLDFDYIGPVWPQYKDAHRVGNGGFSLRSRKLIDALSDHRFEPAHPEDVCICRTHRAELEQHHGIRFASEALAHRFAFEREEPTGPTFGFHGLSNFPDILGAQELAQFVNTAPAELFSSLEARLFIKKLLRRDLSECARIALKKRLNQTKTRRWSDFRLWLRLALQ